jgi:DNA-binding LacI/PurR family transcriptional regulator
MAIHSKRRSATKRPPLKRFSERDRAPRAVRPTIADVARHAAVSPAAVSFAINGRPGVADETRTRILRAAEELGWRPSGSARALSLDRAGAIGLVLARPFGELEVDDFFVRFLAGLERALAARDYSLVLQVVPPGSDGALDAYRRLIASRRVDGVLLTDPVLDDARIDLLAESGLPAVVAGRPWGDCPLAAVRQDEGHGMRALVEHLIAAGHSSVAFIGGDPTHERVAARRWEWIETMRQAGLEPGLSASVVPEDPLARAATARMLDAARRPTAIVYTSDLLAMAGLNVAREHGLEAPVDISIAGFDDHPMAQYWGLTTVSQHATRQGVRAAHALVDALLGARPAATGKAAAELARRVREQAVVDLRTYALDRSSSGFDVKAGEGAGLSAAHESLSENTRLIAARTRGLDGQWRSRDDCLKEAHG